MGLGIIIISITLARFADVPGWRGSVYRSANAGWQLRGEQPGMVQRVTEMHTHQTASFSRLSSAKFVPDLEVIELTVTNEESS